MGEKEIINLIIASLLAIILLCVSFIVILLLHRKRKIGFAKEKVLLAETHQKELLQTQLEVQQQTMQQIGREIHDNIGQKLTLAALYAQQIDYENRFPELKEKIASVATIINESLQDLRELSKSLTSDTLNEKNIVEAIKQQCEIVNQLKTCIIHFNASQSKIILKEKDAIIVVRIVQEFLQNSLKHSKCKNIYINLFQENEFCNLILQDDGIGFLIDTASSNGIGLANIKKRIELMDAVYNLESKPNYGTKLSIRITTPN